MDALRFLKFIEDKRDRPIPFQIKWMKFRDIMTKEDLNVEGNVDFALDKELETLPDNLTISGSLNISHTNLPSLPRNLKVGRHLWMYPSKVKRIPDDIKVGGILDISHNEDLEYLPPNLKLASLYLTNTNIKYLPDNLTVESILDISNTLISEIPKNLKVYLFNIAGSELSKRYSSKKIKRMITERGGKVEGGIYRSEEVAS